MQPTVIELEAPRAERLDLLLGEALAQPRNQVAALIKEGHVTVEGKTAAKPGLKLKPSQRITVTLPVMEPAEAPAVDFDVPVLYEDEHLLIINKPSGLTVHPAPSVKDPTLVDWLKHHDVRLSTLSGEERYGIVHRLDKGTSGVMVVAKTNEAHEALSLQLQDKSMGRYYLAVITPPLKTTPILVDEPIGRSAGNRLKMACVPDGKPAQTLFKHLFRSRDDRQELIACKLYTGRTHQIRVHLERLGRHILGDHLYALGGAGDGSARILLHAARIYFTHPATGEAVCFDAPLDELYAEALAQRFAPDFAEALRTPEGYAELFDFETPPQP